MIWSRVHASALGRPEAALAGEMQLLPVVDIQNGIVVRGVAGQRARYQPIESCLTGSHEVVAVAEAIRNAFGLHQLYVADLDAIQHNRPHLAMYAALSRCGFSISVDAGLRDTARADELLDAGANSVIAGLETIPGFDLLQELVSRFGQERVVFSLDLHAGSPIYSTTWGNRRPGEAPAIAAGAFEAGIRRMIVLDLAAVGSGGGLATLPLCRELRHRFPAMELTTGGGVRGVNDLRELEATGVDAALVASALHNGAITPSHLDPGATVSSRPFGTGTQADPRC